ncbi:hypothetical protein CFC21_059185 [Triticum aestivum]|uniref:CCHC-type domain-containing protein n=2 Tax=Triticum aestivum TaxID=4565 RepID=A0A3B6IW71_WHEAT|nr:hypothetical protein CFC21_059185 [Triticum aestivum]
MLATPPPPPPGGPARDPREVSCVPETPPELLHAAARVAAADHAPTFNAASAGLVTRNNSTSWADRVRGGGARTLNAHSTRAAAAGLEAEDGWVTVASRRPRRPAFPATPFKPRHPIPDWIKGMCFRCLSPHHRQAVCCNQITCRRCFQSGHRARNCFNKPAPHLRPGASSSRLGRPSASGARPNRPSPPRAAPSAAVRPSSSSPSPTAATRLQAHPRTMAWNGDHSLRPAEVFTVIHATPAMHQEAALLGSNAVVAWLDRDLRASTHDIAAAIVEEMGMLPDDVCVVKHFPEAFLVRFFHQHHCADASGRRDLKFRDTRLQMRPWRLEAHSENVDLVHHVRLCLDGLPLQAWDDYAVAQAIEPGCSIDYIETASKLKTDTEVLGVWAWTASPANVPRVNWVTLPARAGGQPIVGRRGLERRVIIHLSIHEDPTQGPKIVSKGYNFQKGVIDGERLARDPRERITRPIEHRRRDRDDDPGRGRDDRERCGRDNSQSREGWGDRIRRSLSRQPKDASRDNRRDEGRDGRRDGGGRRRSAEPAVEDPPSMVLLGSSSGSGDAARGLELLPVQAPPLPAPGRGRSPTRQLSPRLARRRSQEARTPPASPPLSPTTVLPTPPRSKRSDDRPSPLSQARPSHVLLRLCAPDSLQAPLLSPAKPPGFEASPTPPLASSGPLRRTPSPVRLRRTAAGGGAVGLQCLAPLFEDHQEAILPTPAPGLPKAPTARRKTMAGINIAKTGGGFSICKPKAGARPKSAPAARAAKLLVCRSLGIVKDGEDVTAAALDTFADRFKDQLSPDVIVAMRGLFKLDDSSAVDVEEALIAHGGGGALDLVQNGDDAMAQLEAS